MDAQFYELKARIAALEAVIALAEAEIKGGAGSGNWGHAGRKGKRGGSMSKKVAMSRTSGKDWQERQAQRKKQSPPIDVKKQTSASIDDINDNINRITSIRKQFLQNDKNVSGNMFFQNKHSKEYKKLNESEVRWQTLARIVKDNKKPVTRTMAKNGDVVTGASKWVMGTAQNGKFTGQVVKTGKNKVVIKYPSPAGSDGFLTMEIPHSDYSVIVESAKIDGWD